MVCSYFVRFFDVYVDNTFLIAVYPDFGYLYESKMGKIVVNFKLKYFCYNKFKGVCATKIYPILNHRQIFKLVMVINFL